MAKQTDSRSGLVFGFDRGDDGWGADVNQNFQRLAYRRNMVFTGMGVDTPPTSPTEGDAYTVGASPTGAWSSFSQHSIVVWGHSSTGGALAWLNIPASKTIAFHGGSTNQVVYYDGTQWLTLLGLTTQQATQIASQRSFVAIAAGLNAITTDAEKVDYDNLQNKPTIALTADQVTKLNAAISTIYTDSTISGTGLTSGSPLTVATPFTAAEKTKLAGIMPGQGATTLEGLGDTTISSPTNNQLLQYDDTDDKWKNKTVSSSGGATLPATATQAEAEAGTVTTTRMFTPQRVKQAIDALAPQDLSDLDDTTISSPSNNQFLQYDSADSKWKNKTVSLGSGGATLPATASQAEAEAGTVTATRMFTPQRVKQAIDALAPDSLNEMDDTTITSPTNNQLLQYDSADSKWKNKTVSVGGGGATTLPALTDVTIASPADGEVLTYETSTSMWKNKAAASGGGGTTNVLSSFVLTSPTQSSALSLSGTTSTPVSAASTVPGVSLTPSPVMRSYCGLSGWFLDISGTVSVRLTAGMSVQNITLQLKQGTVTVGSITLPNPAAPIPIAIPVSFTGASPQGTTLANSSITVTASVRVHDGTAATVEITNLSFTARLNYLLIRNEIVVTVQSHYDSLTPDANVLYVITDQTPKRIYAGSIRIV